MVGPPGRPATWVRLPRYMWPRECFDESGKHIYADPVVPLLKAHYGLPGSGALGKIFVHDPDIPRLAKVRFAPGHLDPLTRCGAGRVRRRLLDGCISRQGGEALGRHCGAGLVRRGAGPGRQVPRSSSRFPRKTAMSPPSPSRWRVSWETQRRFTPRISERRS